MLLVALGPSVDYFLNWHRCTDIPFHPVFWLGHAGFRYLWITKGFPQELPATNRPKTSHQWTPSGKLMRLLVQQLWTQIILQRTALCPETRRANPKIMYPLKIDKDQQLIKHLVKWWPVGNIWFQTKTNYTSDCALRIPYAGMAPLCLFAKPRVLWPEPQADDTMFSRFWNRRVPVAQTKSKK